MMDFDPEQHMVVIKTVGQWAAQARENNDRPQAAAVAAGYDPQTPISQIRHCDPVAFGLMVEALPALGLAARDLVEVAGLVPVDQAVMGDG